jgi:hypothetical protein
MKYRLYIDEVGNSDLAASTHPNHRYLSLTGVILELGYVSEVVFPAIEGLKQKYFDSHPDEPVILHRKELVNKRFPFHALKEPKIEQNFNQDLLDLLRALDYVVITVVIDKLEHQQRYQVWRFDPYHYCLQILVERYVLWLKDRGVQGDVMAESRGGKEDRRLKDSFTRVYENGTEYVVPAIFSNHLTSKQLKVNPKQNNIAGLQLADLIAHPSYKATLARRNGESLPPFGALVAQILAESKYNRNANGRIWGWGQKLLP